MKIIKNLYNIVIFILMFFLIFSSIYFFNILYTNNIYTKININLTKNIIEHYIFTIMLMSIIASMIAVGTLNKLNGNIAIIISIIILAILVSLYPAYSIFVANNDNIQNEINYQIYAPIDDGKYFTKIDDYIVKSGSKLLDNNRYENAILIDYEVKNKLYFADYMYITDEDIVLQDVVEINCNNKIQKSLIVFKRNSFMQYFKNIIKDFIFNFEIFADMPIKITNSKELPIYGVFVLFGNFLFLFFSLYMLGLSLSSKQYVYHNILNTFFIIFLIKTILYILIKYNNLLEFLDNGLNFWTMSICLYIISILIILSAAILKKLFNSDKKELEEKTIENN